jgi:electron transport complex protein RnfD
MDKKILDKFDYAPETPDKVENKRIKAKPKTEIKPLSIYFEQLLCLCLLAVISYWNSGPRVAVMVGFSVCGAVIMDMVGCALSKKIYNPRDLSTLIAGLCIALLMPAGIPYQLAFFGSALTIGIKHIFGGKDNYIFNPTAAAFAFMILCYPGQMLLFPKPLEHLPVWGEISPTILTGLTSFETVRNFDILMGNITGAMGTVHILVILVSGLCLLFRRSLSATVTITALISTLLLSGVIGAEEGVVRASLLVLVSSSFLFILVFLANDPQTLPKTFLGKIYYGLLFGGTVMLFGRFGKVEGYPAFALIFVNTMSERSDILAFQTVTGIKRGIVFAQSRLNSHETIVEKVESGVVADLPNPSLTDTQEIILIDRQDYDMPPVDNKIIKINRKKPHLLTLIKENLGKLTEKRSLTESTGGFSDNDPEVPDVNFLENLKDGMKGLGSVFKKRAAVKEEVVENAGLTPLEVSLIVDENDVVEVEESANTKMKKAGRVKTTNANTKE